MTRGFLRTVEVKGGAELSSTALDIWTEGRGAYLELSRPRKANDDAFIENFNSRPCDEYLNEHDLTLLVDAPVNIGAFASSNTTTAVTTFTVT